MVSDIVGACCLPALEAERSQTLRQSGTLDDLLRGSICAVARQSGKPPSPGLRQRTLPKDETAKRR